MPKELAICKLGSNEINAVSKIDGLTESTVNKVIKNIHVQSAQLTQIRKFYDDFQAFSHLNFEINTFLNEIKNNTDSQGDLQKLSDMLNRYTYSFYDFVTFSEIYAKKKDKKILFDNLIAYQYDPFYEYRVAYYLGNFAKHVSQFMYFCYWDFQFKRNEFVYLDQSIVDLYHQSECCLNYIDWLMGYQTMCD